MTRVTATLPSTIVRLSLPSNLRDGEILIVEARLSRSLDLVPGLHEYLDADERARAARFLHVADSSRLVLGRGLTRAVMGEVMGIAPADVAFMANPHGKPEVPGGPPFNVSHSGDVVLVAIARTGRIGVDVEQSRGLRDMASLARGTFLPEEAAAVLDAAGEDRIAAFYRVWTRKEAILKALGVGLTALSSIRVSPHPHGPALRAIDLPGERPNAWTLLPVETAPRHPAALATDRPVRHVRILPI